MKPAPNSPQPNSVRISADAAKFPSVKQHMLTTSNDNVRDTESINNKSSINAEDKMELLSDADLPKNNLSSREISNNNVGEDE